MAYLLSQGMFQRVPIEWDAAIAGAEMLSIAHTGRLGARAMDILHVAIAVQLKVDTFLTCDERPGRWLGHAFCKTLGLSPRAHRPPDG